MTESPREREYEEEYHDAHSIQTQDNVDGMCQASEQERVEDQRNVTNSNANNNRYGGEGDGDGGGGKGERELERKGNIMEGEMESKPRMLNLTVTDEARRKESAMLTATSVFNKGFDL